jgi:hypothetical protein
MKRILDKHHVEELRTICREFVDDTTVSGMVETLYPIALDVIGDKEQFLSVLTRAAKEHARGDIEVLQLSVLLSELISQETRQRLFLARVMAPVSWEGTDR